MLYFIARRLGQSVLTIFGVVLVTFFLFRVIAGDIAAANLGERTPEPQKAAWRHRYGYDNPTWINYHRRLTLTDKTTGDKPYAARDAGGSVLCDALALILEGASPEESEEPAPEPNALSKTLLGRYVWNLNAETPIGEMTDHRPLTKALPPAPLPASSPAASSATGTAEETTRPVPAPAEGTAQSASAPAPAPKAAETAWTTPHVLFLLSDGSRLAVDVAGVQTCGDLIRRINDDPTNQGRVLAGITEYHWIEVLNSQFFHHLVNSATFQGQSLKDKRKLTEIIADRAPASLSITVPSMALEFMIGLAIACAVAYYRGGTADKVGVFLSVLGMCIPFLAFMIYGQWAMFALSPRHAYGTFDRANVYLPIAIMVVAALGGNVRFYRTVILDETGRDYVRTARAKGLPLPAVLFKHVLRNCMLPILTSLILSIPFLIMGSLLVESYFGIPGLGYLMLTSINDRNEPIMNGLVFLTAVIYTFGILLTDISYAVFDPRIRLR
jgi:peptide/nickel transport system permease protein